MEGMKKEKLEIKTEINGDTATILLTGRLDTETSEILESTLDTIIERVTFIILDMADLVYISSAGLRVMIATEKVLSRKKGKLTIINCQSQVKDVFSITGFTDIIDIS